MASRIALIIGSLLGGSLALGQDAEPASPFMRKPLNEPAPAPKTTPASPLDAIEFRGVIEIGDIAWISLYDPKTKKSYRLSKNEDGEDGFSLVKYDPGSKRGEETIVVRQGGLTKQLSLKDADIITLKGDPRPTPVRPTQPEPQEPGPTRPQPANPNIEAASDEEVRERMQRVAEEIRRRRSLRRDVIEDGSN